MKTTILIVAVSLLTYETLFAQELLVADGEIVSTEEAPWVGLLSSRSSGCTSVYIGEGWVLTAAHCVDQGTKPEDVTVEFNVDNWCATRSAEFKFKVDDIHIYPNYVTYGEGGNTKNTCYDIALLKLEAEPDIPAINYGPYVNGEDAILYGYGLKENDEESCELRTGNMGSNNSRSLTDSPSCGDLYSFFNDGAISGDGDSGGPVVIYTEPDNKPVLIGLLRGGNNVVTAVYPFDLWIKNTKAGKPYYSYSSHLIPYISTVLAYDIVVVVISLPIIYKWSKFVVTRGERYLSNRRPGQTVRSSRTITYERVPCDEEIRSTD